MDQADALVTKIENLLKAAQNSALSVKNSVDWLTKMKKAVERRDWVQMAVLLRSQDTEFLLYLSGVIPPAEIDCIEHETSKYSLDTRLQFAEHVKLQCEAGAAASARESLMG